MSEEQGWTPRERGLIVGHSWAKVYGGDLIDLKPYAAGEIDVETRTSIREMLVGSGELENPDAFWVGFSRGVVLFLADNGISTQSRIDQDT